MKPSGVTNSFAVDYNAGEHITDINNPPSPRYRYQEFPKLVYHHETGQVLEVVDERQLKAALKHDFQEKPSPGHDYSNMRGAVAMTRPASAIGQVPLSAERLVAMEDDILPSADDLDAVAEEENVRTKGRKK